MFQKFVNELPSTKDLSTGNRDLKSERSVGAPKRRSLALLCFTTLFGLLSIVAAMFTTILPLSAGWRYFWLIICLFAFALSLTCIILFEQSYKKK
jgi:sterol desaturase/sphingolipid hydroxylase (fatty acid hydroxylase superfamily)